MNFFYICFQFSPSISRIFRFIGILLATYSLSREKGHGPIGSLINSSRFFLSPEQRASRILKVFEILKIFKKLKIIEKIIEYNLMNRIIDMDGLKLG